MQTAHLLTDSQLRQLEEELLAERARLERSMAVSAAANGIPALVAESQDGASGGEPAALGDAPRTRVQERYEAILAALQRLAAGEYGRCADCLSPIPFGRLLVMPESERCVACSPFA